MRFALLPILSLTGCLVVPASSKTSRHVGLEPAAEVRKGNSRGITLQASVVHGQAVITAIRTRDCHREVFDVIEVTESRGLLMSVPEDPRGAAFGALLAPVTLPLSLIYSSVAVAANHEERHTVRAPHHVETTACTEPATNVAIEIALPSGATFTDRTDAGGVLAFTIPKAEPAHGVITARAETQIAELKYRRKSALAMRPDESLGQ